MLDLLLSSVLGCIAYVPMPELACNSVCRGPAWTVLVLVGSDCGPECEGLVDRNLEQTVQRF